MTTKSNIENLEQEDEQDDINPIAISIDTFIHSVKDTEEVAYNFIPLAAKVHNERIKRIKEKEKKAEELLSDDNCQSRIIGTNILLEVNRETDRVINANVPETIGKALFLNLFSNFDAYIGDLISCIFHIKPELFNGLGRQISVSEILSFNSFDELKEKVLSDEIDNLRRKSYVEQFSEMEKMFSINLKNFEHWADFVELSQRRNLLMHCNGIVSEQYIKICTQEGYKFKE